MDRPGARDRGGEGGGLHAVPGLRLRPRGQRSDVQPALGDQPVGHLHPAPEVREEQCAGNPVLPDTVADVRGHVLVPLHHDHYPHRLRGVRLHQLRYAVRRVQHARRHAGLLLRHDPREVGHHAAQLRRPRPGARLHRTLPHHLQVFHPEDFLRDHRPPLRLRRPPAAGDPEADPEAAAEERLPLVRGLGRGPHPQRGPPEQ
mmetsp:Transcript_112223/g.317912  ORF Transcript_112223/g.317912 Transcript_112223/m.317912 type:complete len:202 (+) Transcript_112223:1756-2361(+)